MICISVRPDLILHMYTDEQIQAMIDCFLNTPEFTEVLVLNLKTPVKKGKGKKGKEPPPPEEPQDVMPHASKF